MGLIRPTSSRAQHAAPATRSGHRYRCPKRALARAFRVRVALVGFLPKFPQRRIALRFRFDDIPERDLAVAQGVHDDLHTGANTQPPLGSLDVIVGGALAD